MRLNQEGTNNRLARALNGIALAVPRARQESLLTAEAPRADPSPVAGLGPRTRSPMLSGILLAGRQGQRQFVCHAVSPSRRNMVSWQSLLDRNFGLHIDIWTNLFVFEEN